MKIKRLKVEDNSVLVSNESNGKLIIADQSHISSLESLLERIEKHKFAKKNKRENIVFEKEFDVGAGSMKSYRDQDGDFVCTYQMKIKSTPIEINEDYDFELESKKECKGQSNLWGSDKDEPVPLPFTKRGKEIKEEGDEDFLISNIQDLRVMHRNPPKADEERISSREVYDISFHRPGSSESHNQIETKFAVPRAVVTKHTPPDYKFQKRPIPNCMTNKMRVFSVMLRELRTYKPTNIFTTGLSNLISFAKKDKWRPSNRMDGEFFKAIFRYNRLYGIEGTVERNFYLNSEKNQKVTDEEFERLLKATVESK
ncbi:uncharacterized protein VICG_00574 [Vittaforma corneae ATCC 50505]|uniref:Uncharacterized protein n=1 Tax=Vittaforma corneae (strain ATCC 50505) TaxID=993615 RepID=L2GPP1_VITCO|nr:uncharacterized protein VICG_00574 [Vittaforma corneae ATCC 50505]ELA42475.1 hypothetical protein VICG_00574 [Vittaforma corneae ATCC 50505]